MNEGWMGWYVNLVRMGGRIWNLEFTTVKIVKVNQLTYGVIYHDLGDRRSVDGTPIVYKVKKEDIDAKDSPYFDSLDLATERAIKLMDRFKASTKHHLEGITKKNDDYEYFNMLNNWAIDMRKAIGTKLDNTALHKVSEKYAAWEKKQWKIMLGG